MSKLFFPPFFMKKTNNFLLSHSIRSPKKVKVAEKMCIPGEYFGAN